MSVLEDFFSDIAAVEKDIVEDSSNCVMEEAVGGKRKAETESSPSSSLSIRTSNPNTKSTTDDLLKQQQTEDRAEDAVQNHNSKRQKSAPASKLASHHLPSVGMPDTSNSISRSRSSSGLPMAHVFASGIPPPPQGAVSTTCDESTGLIFRTIKDAKTMNKQSDKAAERAKKQASTRVIAGQTWRDESMLDWPENDFRMFVGNIDGSIVQSDLDEYFKSRYDSVAMTKVIMEVRGQKKGKSRGYGFVSFLDAMECAKAIRTENGNFLGPRPMQIKKSEWKTRDVTTVQKKEQKKTKMLQELGVLD